MYSLLFSKRGLTRLYRFLFNVYDNIFDILKDVTITKPWQ